MEKRFGAVDKVYISPCALFWALVWIRGGKISFPFNFSLMECNMSIIINISKAGKSLSIDWEALPDVAKSHIIEYGLRQKLNDAGSQFKKGEEGTEANAFAAAETVLEALKKGLIRVNTSIDAGEKALRKMAELFCKKAGIPVDKEDSLEDLLEALGEKLGREPDAIRASLEKKVEAEAAVKAQIAAIKAQSASAGLDL